MSTTAVGNWVSVGCDEQAAKLLAGDLGVSIVLARLLVNRGLTSPAAADEFLNPSMDRLHDPFDLPDMALAAARVVKAIRGKEKILVHGDYDVDGISSAALLVRMLRALDADVIARVPHRKRDGYDIKPATIEEAKAKGVTLVITADCGVTACETASHAEGLGIDLVVTDHHEPGPHLPKAVAVVNPRRRGCHYPFKDLAGVGVAFKLAQAVVRELGLPEASFQRKFLDLVALGTVGDVCPLLGENRTLVKFGMEDLASTRKVGLRSLIRSCDLEGKPLTTYSLGFQLGPRINAVGRMDDSAIALQLFLTKDEAEAIDLVGVLQARNSERQAEQARVWSDVVKMLDGRDLDGTHVVVLAAAGWNAGVVGIVANKVVENYFRPAILISANEETGIGSGSARSIDTFDIGAALEQCRDLLLRCGGHAFAAGVSLKLDKLEAFEERLNSIAAQVIKPEDLIPHLEVEGELGVEDITESLLEDLARLEPFGVGNPEPLFMTRRAESVDCKTVGSDQAHLKLRVRGDATIPVDCIAFGFGPVCDSIPVGSSVDLCYNVRRNSYNGNESIQLMVKDLNASGRS